MDLARPIEAIVPGARGLILGALIRAGRELSTSDAGRLANVSAPQASRVLRQLVELGVVEHRNVPPAVVYRPTDGNFVVELLRELGHARDRVIGFARTTAPTIYPAPIRLSIYGSIARGGGGPNSDIDICVIRPDHADDDDGWVESIDAWRLSLERFAGSPVNILEVSESEWRSRDLGSSLWKSMAADELLLAPTRPVGAAR
jgi:predicted nucleotidyltransferase